LYNSGSTLKLGSSQKRIDSNALHMAKFKYQSKFNWTSLWTVSPLNQGSKTGIAELDWYLNLPIRRVLLSLAVTNQINLTAMLFLWAGSSTSRVQLNPSLNPDYTTRPKSSSLTI